MKKVLIDILSSAIDARRNCIKLGNAEWKDKWEEFILKIEKDHLPHGSGVDCGCKVDMKKSSRDKVLISLSYHHMNENGYYDGWTEHIVTVTPSFSGWSNIKISGRDRNYIKDYLSDLFNHCLHEEIEYSFDS